jgi:hypothetical protein
VTSRQSRSCLTVAMHLMTASAVACGLAENEDGTPREADLAEARILINALAARW